MLLKEEKTENNHTCYFDSSNILACRYKRDTSQLAIIFKGGTQYLYEGVAPYNFQRFKVAKSQGVAFNERIKKNFTTTKVAEDLDLTEILVTIKEFKKNQKM